MINTRFGAIRTFSNADAAEKVASVFQSRTYGKVPVETWQQGQITQVGTGDDAILLQAAKYTNMPDGTPCDQYLQS